MSVDNISDLGRHGLDELVPSRYAVSVGDIDVLVISDGVLPITAKTHGDQRRRDRVRAVAG